MPARRVTLTLQLNNALAGLLRMETRHSRRSMADRSSAGAAEVVTRNRAIVERVAAGLSLRAVGAEFSLDYTMVWKIAARAGVHSSCRRGRRTASPSFGSCAARA
jgi:hypothetical protein